jgi:hypothetical protein
VCLLTTTCLREFCLKSQGEAEQVRIWAACFGSRRLEFVRLEGSCRCHALWNYWLICKVEPGQEETNLHLRRVMENKMEYEALWGTFGLQKSWYNASSRRITIGREGLGDRALRVVVLRF